MKIKATITLDFDAPDGADAWSMVRAATTVAGTRLVEGGCSNVRPEITGVRADGKRVTYRPMTRAAR